MAVIPGVLESHREYRERQKHGSAALRGPDTLQPGGGMGLRSVIGRAGRHGGPLALSFRWVAD